MPRLTASAPKYRRHKASGQAIVSIQGKDHYLGPYGTKGSKVEYDRLIGEWLAAGRPAAVVAPPNEVTVMEVASAFLKHAKRYYVKNGESTGTAENFLSVLAILRKLYGHTRAADFGPLSLKSLQAAMVKDGKSRRYINDCIFRVRQVFRWAASEQLISPVIPQALEMVDSLRKGHSEARETAPVMPVDDATVDATLPHLPSVVADMVRLQRLTGARPGEIIQLRPADVDRSGEVWRFVPASHKTEHHGHARTIYIGPKAQAVLLPYLLRDAEQLCFRPCDSEKKRRQVRHEARVTPLSCGNVPGSNKRRRSARPAGESYTNDSYRRAIVRGCELAFGLPKNLRFIPKGAKDAAQRREAASEWREKNTWSPHQLRHTAATEIRQRFGLEAAQVSLGHSRMDATQIYAERNSELAVNVAKQIG